MPEISCVFSNLNYNGILVTGHSYKFDCTLPILNKLNLILLVQMRRLILLVFTVTWYLMSLLIGANIAALLKQIYCRKKLLILLD